MHWENGMPRGRRRRKRDQAAAAGEKIAVRLAVMNAAAQTAALECGDILLREMSRRRQPYENALHAAVTLATARGIDIKGLSQAAIIRRVAGRVGRSSQRWSAYSTAWRDDRQSSGAASPVRIIMKDGISVEGEKTQ
jgi:hypothetical protein